MRVACYDLVLTTMIFNKDNQYNSAPLQSRVSSRLALLSTTPTPPRTPPPDHRLYPGRGVTTFVRTLGATGIPTTTASGDAASVAVPSGGNGSVAMGGGEDHGGRLLQGPPSHVPIVPGAACFLDSDAAPGSVPVVEG